MAATTLTWTGGAVNSNWSNPENWGGTVAQNTTNPNSTPKDQYVAKFAPIVQEDGTLIKNITAQIDLDVFIAGIVIEGDVNVTLFFNADGCSLILEGVPPGVIPPTGGIQQIYFNQVAGATSTLTLETGANSVGVINTALINVEGNAGGQSKLIVKQNIQLNLSENLDAEGRRFDLDVENGASLAAKNFYVLGKDLTANAKSTINIAGELVVSEWTHIGGSGIVEFNVTGSVSSDYLWVSNSSTMRVSGAGAEYIGSHNVFLTEPGAFGPALLPAPRGTGAGNKGASLTVENEGKFTLRNFASLSMVSGDGTTIIVRSKGILSAYNLDVMPGSTGHAGPRVTVVGNGTQLTLRGSLYVGGGETTFKSGQFVVSNEATVEVANTSSFDSKEAQSINELSVTNKGVFRTHRLYIGAASGFANVVVKDAGSVIQEFDPATDVVIGKISTAQTLATVIVGKDASFIAASNIDKKVYAVLGGAGKYEAGKINNDGGTIRSAGKGADFIPGDSDFPYGTLTLDTTADGKLDASAGTTLRSKLGSISNEASLLSVTGDATLAPPSATGDSIAELLVTSEYSTSYTPGTTFTVLHANGILTGTFNNLPAGDYWTSNPALPTLSPGLGWRVAYSDHDVTLTIISFIRNAYAQGRVGIVGSGDFEMDMGKTSSQPQQQKNFLSGTDWQSGASKSFTLTGTFNTLTNKTDLIYSITSYNTNTQSMQTYTINWSTSDPISFLRLTTTAKAATSSITVSNLVLDGTAIDSVSSAASGVQSNTVSLGSVGSTFTLTGDVTMNWTSTNRPTRSHLAFLIGLGTIV